MPFPPVLFFILLFVLGLAAGSFLNVVILRYAPEKGFSLKRLSGRSHCMYCHKTLAWIELIPVVSFIVQGGRCRKCRARLTVQYPIVELISGALFVGIPVFLNNFFSMHAELFATLRLGGWYYLLVALWILVFLTLLAATVIDMRHFVIPDEMNIFLGVLGVAITAVIATHMDALSIFRISFLRHYALIFSSWKNPIVLHIVGAFAGGLIFLLLHVLSRGRAMGFGDVKLAFAVGLIFGWPDVALAIALSFVFGGLWGLGLLILGNRTMRDKVPFAPFFVLGTLVTFFFGFSVLASYFHLFNI